MLRFQPLRLASRRLPVARPSPTAASLPQPTAYLPAIGPAPLRRFYASPPPSARPPLWPARRRSVPSRESTGDPFSDDKDLPLLDRRLWSRDTLMKWAMRYLTFFVAPIAVGLVVYTEWTREEQLEALVHTRRTFTTRFRLPTRADPQNVREDHWPVVSRAEAERVLRRAARSVDVDNPASIVKRIDTAAIAANAPIEDREADAIVAGPDGGSSFFAVYDGHSGYRTSHLLSRTLIPSLSLALAPIAAQPTSSLTSPGLLSLAGLKRSVGGMLSSTGAGAQSAAALTEVERTVQVIQDGFEALDRSIVWDAVSLLPANQQRARASASADAGLPVQDGYTALLPALSGSCALVSYLPPDQANLYVALAGDCRAVAGFWVPPATEGEQGSWRVKVLTEDQTGRNEKEVKRMQAEHPGEEVVRRGRVLGGLEPSRAFGDARYKWPRAIQEQLYAAFLPAEMEGKQPRPTPPTSRTPPYVTARPEVTCLRLKGADAEEGELRFLVMATDGLYDRLSNEAIVGLVGTYLASPTTQGAVPKADVLATVVAPSGTDAGFDGKRAAVRARKETADGAFMFGKDVNAATLLIRNSLAGADAKHMCELLSVKSPVTRLMRDDTTVKVVFFNERPAPRDVYKPVQTWSERFWHEIGDD